MTIVDPNDFTECCNGLGGEGCGHKGLIRMPHLHADTCPLVLAAEKDGTEPPMFREDPEERKQFDRSTSILGEGNPMISICGSLDVWGRAHMRNGISGSYSQQCFVMANECIKAARRIKELEARLADS